MRKKITILCSLCMILLLTGCSNNDIKFNPYSFNLNFRYFLLPNTQSIHAVKINSIDLEQDNITLEDLTKINNIIYTIYKENADKDFYLNNFENEEIFYDRISKFCNPEYIERIQEDNNFKESIDNIYYKDDTYWYDAQIISLNSINKEKFFEIEIIALNDTSSFQIEYVRFYVDNENRITKIELVNDLENYENTTKPLGKDSLLNKEGIHTDFITSFNIFKNGLSNGALYKKYHLANSSEILMTDEEHESTQEEIDSMEYKDQMESQLNTLIENQKNEFDKEVLREFFLSGEGTFQNTFVTAYKIDDVNGMAESHYTIQSVANGELKTFLFTFDRIDKEITNIELTN